MNERQKGRFQFVVARGDTPEVLEASEDAFDQVAVSVKMAIEAALGKSIGTRRNDGLCAGGLDLRNEMIGVVALVRDDGVRREVLDGLGCTVAVGNLTGRENHPQRITQGIHRDMQFGCQPARERPISWPTALLGRQRNAGGRARWSNQ